MPRSSPPGTPPRADERPRPASRNWRGLLADYGPPILVMGLIFLASMDAGSSEHSGRIVERLLVWLGLGRRVTGEQFAAINHYVRKLGHLTEYGILAVVLHRAIAHGRARWTIRVVIVVLGVVLLYAASDEFHQSFVATRTPSVWDVLLDTTGAALVLALKAAGEQRWRRR